ncbi:MAG: hypothetical protein JWO05_163 [Gemmatimonadetes bacterium]|nr:hypothetical protein [Gemmatimonadota bacterium]
MLYPAPELASAVDEYRRTDNLGVLLDRVRRLAGLVSVEALRQAAAPFQELPEVMIPVYEHVVANRPADAQAMVILANAYWLTGRGPDVVGELAERAKVADPQNRGAWHLWALAQSDPRARMERWEQVATAFPTDQLARAALADNAASVAGNEHDPLALDLAVRTYESLLAEAVQPEHRTALTTTIDSLRNWKL